MARKSHPVVLWEKAARELPVPPLHRGALTPPPGSRIEVNQRYCIVVYDYLLEEGKRWASEAERELFEGSGVAARGAVPKDISSYKPTPSIHLVLRELAPTTKTHYRIPHGSTLSWPDKPVRKAERATESTAEIRGEHLRKPPPGGYVVHCPVCWKAGHYMHASSRHNTLGSAQKARDAHVCREK